MLNLLTCKQNNYFVMSLYLSIIVPVYNEEDSVVSLHRGIFDICSKLNKSFEIIFVNDGSTDQTLEKLKNLNNIKVINFRTNFGQTAALDAGIKAAKGDFLVTMDGDGQNDPNDIPKLLREIEGSDYDVVSGWRKDRKDPYLKRKASLCAAFMRKILINDGIHDSGCTLKVYKRECFYNIDLSGEMHRFIPAILKVKGFKIGEVVVNHHERKFGKTKYNWKRGIKGNLDMFSLWFWKKFAGRPLHLFGSFALMLVFLSIIIGAYLVYMKIFWDIDLSDDFLSYIAIYLFIIGIQFFVFGLMSDMISKIYFNSKSNPIYDIKEVIDK